MKKNKNEIGDVVKYETDNPDDYIWPSYFSKNINFNNLSKTGLKKWINAKLFELMQTEDEILSEYILHNLFEKSDDEINPKKLYSIVKNFIGKKAFKFITDLWIMCLKKLENPTSDTTKDSIDDNEKALESIKPKSQNSDEKFKGDNDAIDNSKNKRKTERFGKKSEFQFREKKYIDENQNDRYFDEPSRRKDLSKENIRKQFNSPQYDHKSYSYPNDDNGYRDYPNDYRYTRKIGTEIEKNDKYSYLKEYELPRKRYNNSKYGNSSQKNVYNKRFNDPKIHNFDSNRKFDYYSNRDNRYSYYHDVKQRKIENMTLKYSHYADRQNAAHSTSAYNHQTRDSEKSDDKKKSSTVKSQSVEFNRSQELECSNQKSDIDNKIDANLLQSAEQSTYKVKNDQNVVQKKLKQQDFSKLIEKASEKLKNVSSKSVSINEINNFIFNSELYDKQKLNDHLKKTNESIEIQKTEQKKNDLNQNILPKNEVITTNFDDTSKNNRKSDNEPELNNQKKI